MKRLLCCVLMYIFCFSLCAQAEKPALASAPATTSKPVSASSTKEVNPIVLSNQMMIIFMERMKNGDLKEAREIALGMIQGHDKFKDTDTVEFKSFASLPERRLYEIKQAQEGRKAEVRWVEQPIADGFYFLAMLEFNEKKVDAALEYLQKAINWNPVHSPFFFERGFMMLHQEKRPDLAIIQGSYLTALELANNYQDFAAALRGMGYLLVERGDIEGAIACYVRSMLYDPGEKTMEKEISFLKSRSPGVGAELDGTKSAAMLTQKKIPAGISPLHVQVLLTIADDMSKSGNSKEMKAVLKQAQLLDPKNPAIQQRLQNLK